MPFRQFKRIASKARDTLPEERLPTPPEDRTPQFRIENQTPQFRISVRNPPAPYTKRIATKTKKAPREEGQSSKNLLVKGKNLAIEENNPPAENTPPQVREFSGREWALLLRRFSMSQVCWFMQNNEAKVETFVDKVLAYEEEMTPNPSPPKKDLPDDYLDYLLRDDRQQEAEEELEEETISVRYCVLCESFGCKADIVRCRKCGYWYHTECAGELDQKGRDDPNFSFWLCPKCKPDPKVSPGYKFTYRSEEDIEKDKHYKDSDYDLEPDFRVFT